MKAASYFFRISERAQYLYFALSSAQHACMFSAVISFEKKRWLRLTITRIVAEFIVNFRVLLKYRINKVYILFICQSISFIYMCL